MPVINQITNFKIGGVTYTGTSAQLNFNSGVIAGAALPSKTMVLDASGTISGITSLNATNINATNMTIANLLLNGVPLTADSLGLISGVVPGTLSVSKALSVDAFGKLNSTLNVGNSIIAGDFGTNNNGTNGSNGLFRFITSAGTCFIQSGVTLTADSSADIFFGNLQSSIATSSRKIIFKANGFVGINTSSPTYTLDVVGTTRVQNLLLGTSTDSTKMLSALDSAQLDATRRGIMIGKNLNNFNNFELFWNSTIEGSTTNYAGFSITGFGDILSLVSSGRVGINTNVPTRQLDINSTTGNCLRLIRNNVTTNAADFTVDAVGRLTITTSSGNINIPTHNGTTTGLELAGVLLTASATDLNAIGGLVPGVVTPSKLLIVDSNKDLGSLRNLTVGGLFTNFNVGNLLAISYGNTELAGRPIKYELVNAFSTLTNYNPSDSLDGGTVYSTNYSLEIIGYIKPQFTETYTFFVTGDDRVRLWVNDTLLFQSWANAFTETASATISLVAGVWYPIRIHLQQQTTSGSSMNLRWQSVSQSIALIPSTRMAWDNKQSLTQIRPSVMNGLTVFNSSASLSVQCTSALSATGGMSYNITGGSSPIYTFNDGSLNIAAHTSGSIGLQLAGISVNALASELNYNAGLTLGTISPSKVITVDSSSRINNELQINASAVVGDITGTNGILKINNSSSGVELTCGLSTAAGSAADLFIGNYNQNQSTSSRKFIIKANGSVGIGTTTPSYPLMVLTSGSTYGLSHSNGTVVFNTFLGGVLAGAYLQTQTNHPLILSTNNSAGQIILSTNGSFDIVNHNGSSTGLQLSGTLVSSTAVELNRLSGVTAGTALGGKALILDSSSNITGINNFIATNVTGTIQTAAQPNITSLGTLTTLNVVSVSATGPINITQTANGRPFASINGTTTCGLYHFRNGDAYFGAITASNLAIQTDNVARIYITAIGNVGIRNTSPSFALHVTGTARATNGIFGVTSFSTSISSQFIIQTTTGANASVITNNTVSLATVINSASANIFTTDVHTLSLGANNSTEILNIISGGNVGINTTTPSHSLHVNGAIRCDSQLLIGTSSAISSNYFIDIKSSGQSDNDKIYMSLGKSNTLNNRVDMYYHHTTNGSTSNYAGFAFGGSTNLFNIYSSGRVSIGVASPSYLLDVGGSAKVSQLLVGTSTDSSVGMLASMLDSSLANGSTTTQLLLGKANTTRNSLSATWVHTSDGSTSNYSALNTVGNTNMLVLSANGNVGIGNSAPELKFDVLGSSRTTSLIIGNSTTTPGNSTLSIIDSNITSSAHRNIVIGTDISARNLIEIGFRLVSSGSTSNYGSLGLHTTGPVLSWTGGGNVGIGTTTPTQKLEVNGITKVTRLLVGNNASNSVPIEVGVFSSSYNVSYGYLNSAGGTGTSSAPSAVNFSLRCDGRIIVGGEVNVVSDRRIKDNIVNLYDKFCLDFINKVEPVSYVYNNTVETKTHYGFIAQDMIKHGFEQLVTLVPESGLAETIDDDGFVNPKDMKFVLCYDEIIPILTKNIQLMSKSMQAMSNKIEQLEQVIINLQS